MADEKRKKSIEMAEIMTPNMANFSGNIHGGYLLSFLDKVAYACAARYTGSGIVTLSVDSVFFKEPIHVGDLVTCLAQVNYVGRTSLEVGIKVIAENLQTRTKRHTNTCYFTMVAIDAEGKPAAIPPLTLEKEVDKRRFEEGRLRREMRLKFNSLHQQKKTKPSDD